MPKKLALNKSKAAYRAICHQPGITYSELGRVLRITYGQIESILVGLEKAGLLVYEEGKHLYPYKESY